MPIPSVFRAPLKAFAGLILVAFAQMTLCGSYVPSSPPGLFYFAGGGTANAQTVTMSPVVSTALYAGLSVCWLPTAANTTTTPTLAVNGLTAKTITKLGATALAASDLTTTAVACAVYDGTEFQLQNPQSGGGGGTGTVTSVSSGNASPLFNVAVSNPTTTPSFGFSLLNFAAHTFYGNNTGSTAAPGAQQPACGDLSNAAASCSTDATNASNISSGTLNAARLPATYATLGANTFTGQQINSLNGAALTPPLLLSGTWFSGGSATTTKPQYLIECNSGTTTSNNWSTSGTGFGVNGCSGFGGKLIDLQTNGADYFSVSGSGSLRSSGNWIMIPFNGNTGSGFSGLYVGGSNEIYTFADNAGNSALSINSNGGSTAVGIGNKTSYSVGTTLLVQDGTTSTGATRMSVLKGAADSASTILFTDNGSASIVGSITNAGAGATGAGDVALCWTTTGIFTQGATCGVSLARYKQNIAPLSHGLDYVMQMRPVTFDWKDSGKRDLGMIADEVAAVDPLLGAYDKDGRLYNFKDREVLTTAIKAVQELKTENDGLRARIAALEKRK